MLEGLREFTAKLDGIDKVVREVKTAQVSQRRIRDTTRHVVDQYFRDLREQLLVGGVEQSMILAFDADMHDLLEISHRRSTVQTYRSHLRKLKHEVLELEKLALTVGSTTNHRTLEPVDQHIIRTLASLLPSAARSYEQAIRDLGSSDRLSWRGPATDLRECLRETLDHLAPDKEVAAQQGFKLEKDASDPTMKQKVRYILKKRGLSRSLIQSPETAVEAVDEIVGTFVRSVYTRSNVSTHTPTDKNEVLRVRDWVRVSLCELLEIRTGV